MADWLERLFIPLDINSTGRGQSGFVGFISCAKIGGVLIKHSWMLGGSRVCKFMGVKNVPVDSCHHA